MSLHTDVYWWVLRWEHRNKSEQKSTSVYLTPYCVEGIEVKGAAWIVDVSQSDERQGRSVYLLC